MCPVIAHSVVIERSTGNQVVSTFRELSIHSGAESSSGKCMNNIMRTGVIHFGED